MVYVKFHREGGDTLVACCDSDLLGREFLEGGLRLHVSKAFYGGEVRDISDLEELLSKATVANLTGNRVVDRAVELGYVDEDCVLTVAGVKHAQVVQI